MQPRKNSAHFRSQSESCVSFMHSEKFKICINCSGVIYVIKYINSSVFGECCEC